jgi:ribosomal protein L18E
MVDRRKAAKAAKAVRFLISQGLLVEADTIMNKVELVCLSKWTHYARQQINRRGGDYYKLHHANPPRSYQRRRLKTVTC